jgi:hypothetical protein
MGSYVHRCSFVDFLKRYIPESCQAFMHLKMVRFASMEPLSFSCVSWGRPVMGGLFAVVLQNGGKTNGCQNDVMRIDATIDVDKDTNPVILSIVTRYEGLPFMMMLFSCKAIMQE